jgi:hypothetical protein
VADKWNWGGGRKREGSYALKEQHARKGPSYMDNRQSKSEWKYTPNRMMRDRLAKRNGEKGRGAKERP